MPLFVTGILMTNDSQFPFPNDKEAVLTAFLERCLDLVRAEGGSQREQRGRQRSPSGPQRGLSSKPSREHRPRMSVMSCAAAVES